MSKFKIGDSVICVPGFRGGDGTWLDNRYGGYGYEENLIFTINEISENGWNDSLSDSDCVYWGDATVKGGGVFGRSLKLMVCVPWHDSKLVFRFI